MEQRKKISFILLFSLMSFYSVQMSLAQSCYSPFVDSVISNVLLENLSRHNRELTGDTSTIIGGQPYRIISRYRFAPGNDKAAQYIYEKFLSYGLDTRYMIYSSTGKNVIAKKTGTRFPNQQILVTGHYDDIVGTLPIPDTIPGSDDNASGVCGVLEAARILNMYDWDYTFIFIAFDEEEGLGAGSTAYADSAYIRGDSIVCVFNMDMIAWHSRNDNVFDVRTNPASNWFANLAVSSSLTYSPLYPVKRIYLAGGSGSDEGPFWAKGFRAITTEEDYTNFNNHYHTVLDRYEYLNLPYFLQIAKSEIAALVVFEKDYIINFTYNPLPDSTDTLSRTASIVISSHHPIALASNAPCLYYRGGSGSYSRIDYSYHNLDTFKYVIPGFPPSTVVSYYFAAQDSAGTLVATYPAGGRGYNPPGTSPPLYPLMYRVLASRSYCSNSVPRALPPLQAVFDTIIVASNSILYDLDVNLTITYPNDQDLLIALVDPEGNLIRLSYGNGGSGANYINTTFDDEAADSIKNGTPPFTGRFIPESPLRISDNKPVQGIWKLRIYNSSASITGQLVSWCLNTLYYNPIGIVNNRVPVRCELMQNYPNPFNPSTRISFSIDRQSDVKLIIYDILGREIGTLVNRKLNQGDYNFKFSGQGLSSGVYFYVLYLNGNRFDAKKMVLVK
jgi:subtilisin-like proprotein convertase family protein